MINAQPNLALHQSTDDNARHYESWYHTPRGAWIATQEAELMRRLLAPAAGDTLLDVGCGGGHFSRRFADYGLRVTGLDPDAAMVDFARRQGGAIDYLIGTGQTLPFADAAFDYVTAVTSLCFIADPEAALREMWRVSGKAVCLGLLNRHSLLYRRKAGRGAYSGARWDTVAQVRQWARHMSPPPRLRIRSAVFAPSGGALARGVERLLPARLPWGGFLAVCLDKPGRHRP